MVGIVSSATRWPSDEKLECRFSQVVILPEVEHRQKFRYIYEIRFLNSGPSQNIFPI